MYLGDWVREAISRRREIRELAAAQERRRREALASGRQPGHIACLPGRPSPYAQINTIAAALGLRITGDPNEAQAVLFWHPNPNSAFNRPPDSLVSLAEERVVINIGATDISKTKVARTFELAFGRSLSIDPRIHTGPAVEKPEGNGLRTAKIVECPTDPVAGFSYQRLIDNRLEGEARTLDLRVAIYGDEVPYLIRKERSIEARFGQVTELDLIPTLHRPDEFLDEGELTGLVEMARRLGADYCEIDCVRDRNSGLLYAVDVNTTPAWFDGFRPAEAEEVIRTEAEAFERIFLGDRQEAGAARPNETPVTRSISASIPGKSRSAE